MSELVERALMLALGGVLLTSALLFLTPAYELLIGEVGEAATAEDGDPPWIFTEICRGAEFVRDFPEYRHQKSNVTLPAGVTLEVRDATTFCCTCRADGTDHHFCRDLGVETVVEVASTREEYTLYIFMDQDVLHVYLS